MPAFVVISVPSVTGNEIKGTRQMLMQQIIVDRNGSQTDDRRTGMGLTDSEI